MNTNEIRAKHLKKLDELYQELRGIVSDPKWCNEDYKPYVTCVERITSTIKRIQEVNSVEVEAGS